MNLKVLSRQNGSLAAMRTSDGKTTALGVVGTQSIEYKLLVAVATSNQPLGALSQFVLTEMSPLYFHAAFVLAVEGFVATGTAVLL